MGAPYIYIYDISRLRVKHVNTTTASSSRLYTFWIVPSSRDIINAFELRAAYVSLAYGFILQYHKQKPLFVSSVEYILTSRVSGAVFITKINKNARNSKR